MLYVLMLVAEILLTVGLSVLLLLCASTEAAIVVAALLLLALVLVRPALRLSRRFAAHARTVIVTARARKPEAAIPIPPSALSPAEVARLLEGAGYRSVLPARSSALNATLLELNCRGIVGVRSSGDGEYQLMLPENRAADKERSGEKYLLDVFYAASHEALTLRLRIFTEYAARHPRAVQRKCDSFDRAVTEQLIRKGCFARTGTRFRPTVSLTPKGAHEAILWREYCRALCQGKASFMSYPDNLERFRAEMGRALCVAEAAGVYEQVRRMFLRDYVFEPSQLFFADRIFAHLANEDDHFHEIIRKTAFNVLSFGTNQYRGDEWDDILAESEGNKPV